MSRAIDLSLYLVTDTAQCGGPRGVVQTVRQAIAGGVTAVQLRDPDASDDEFVRMGRELADAMAGTGVPLLINDRVHLVEAIGAAGAHVGQGDLDIVSARAVLGPERILGLSAATEEQLAAAERSTRDAGHPLLDYIGVGAFRATATKPDHPPAGGLELLSRLARRSPWPCVAIGGITVDDLPAIRGTGMAGVAVVSALCGRPDVTAAARALFEAWAGAVSPGRPPVALTIAGSDPSGGAGIQADLKSFSALGAFGTSVITALTAQNTVGVTGIHVVPADFVALQLDTLLDDVRIDAVKIGMLASAELADTVRVKLTERPQPRLVIDPVMVATSGDRLLDDDALDALRRLLPLADVITPNLGEAALLTGTPVASTLHQMRRQAQLLRDAGAQRVLLKGGHLEGEQAIDLFVDSVGEHELAAPRVHTVNTHGTGCSLSSAIAALAPQRLTWLDAVTDAKRWLTDALRAADQLQIGHGHGPVHHFHALWPTHGDVS